MTNKSFLLTILVILSWCNCLGQTSDNYNPLLLIPFNNHGLWGWSDTLGNIVIEPGFEQNDFFTKEQNEYYSKVKINGNTNYYVLNKGLLVPRNYQYASSNKSIINRFYLIETNSKYGLYDFENDKIVVKPKFGYGFTSGSSNYFFKDNKKFYYFDSKSSKLKKTEFIDYWTWEYDSATSKGQINLLLDSDSIWYHVVNEKFEEVNFESASWNMGESISFDLDVCFRNLPEKKFYKTGKNEFLHTLDFSEFPVVEEKYGYQQLLILSTPEGIEIKENNNSDLLKNQSDSIKLVSINCAPLYRGVVYYKDGLAGLKLFFTTYPAIRPKYIEIEREIKTIDVSENWSFAIISAFVKGHKVYIGENGIEYFNLN